MATNDKQQIHFGRPKDKSLKAYKDFIQGMTRALLGSEAADNDDSMTDADYEESWKKFWESAEQSTTDE